VQEQDDMSNWIDSGGRVPHQCSDAYSKKNSKNNSQIYNAGRWRAPLGVTGAVFLMALASPSGHARDRGQFGNSTPEMRAWFEGLRSGKGPCCSDADGSLVSDVDWETHDGHYRVRIDGQWIDVPDDAVITEPNRIGRAMVWPIHGYLGLTVRCFMPGSMT
jgi:hypothetical protein